MKRLMLATVALSLLATPAAFAGEWGGRHHPQPEFGMQYQPAKPYRHWQPEVKKPHWKKGQRLSNWKQRQQRRDYKRHGLRKPGRGHEWVRVGNDYLLIAITSGIIAGLIAAK